MKSKNLTLSHDAASKKLDEEGLNLIEEIVSAGELFKHVSFDCSLPAIFFKCFCLLLRAGSAAVKFMAAIAWVANRLFYARSPP